MANDNVFCVAVIMAVLVLALGFAMVLDSVTEPAVVEQPSCVDISHLQGSCSPEHANFVLDCDDDEYSVYVVNTEALGET